MYSECSAAIRRLQSRKNLRGFTLIELMVVVAVIGLLAGIAVPGYQEYVRKGKRAEGKAALLAAASRLERYYTQNNCYPSAGTTCGTVTTSTAAMIAAGIPAFSGEDPAKASYNISLTLNPQDFIITASPKAPFVDSKCGNFTLSNTGAKFTQKDLSTNDASPIAGCWF